MKVAMNGHVDQERYTMFQHSADEVKIRLASMMKEVEALMNDRSDEVFVQMRRDYRAVLGGGDVPQDGELLPKTQRLVRREVMNIIDGVERMFSKVAGLEVEDQEGENKEELETDRNNDEEADDQGGASVGKQKTEEIAKREASPSTQLVNEEGSVASRVKEETVDDKTMADAPKAEVSSDDDSSSD